MKIHHFIIKYCDFEAGYIDDKIIYQQIIKVLKIKRGEHIWLGNGENSAIVAEIVDFDSNKIYFKILEKIAEVENISHKVILACSVLKKENFELVVQKATELGVHEIVPFISARTVKTGLRQDRLEIIAREASEQSGRGIVPNIAEIANFDELVLRYKNIPNKFICDIAGNKLHLADFESGNKLIVIGPEGGFEEKELDLATEKGFKKVSLSGFTLRAETAAIIASAQLKS